MACMPSSSTRSPWTFFRGLLRLPESLTRSMQDPLLGPRRLGRLGEATGARSLPAAQRYGRRVADHRSRFHDAGHDSWRRRSAHRPTSQAIPSGHALVGHLVFVTEPDAGWPVPPNMPPCLTNILACSPAFSALFFCGGWWGTGLLLARHEKMPLPNTGPGPGSNEMWSSLAQG